MMTPIEITIAERLVVRFANLNDGGAYRELSALFAPNGPYLRPSDGNPIVGAAAIEESFCARPRRKTRHIVTNVLVEILGAQQATCESAIVLFIADDGEPLAVAKCPALIGGLRDRLVKLDDAWLFEERFGFLDMSMSV